MNQIAAQPLPITSETQQFLTFTLGKEEFGVDIMMVREVKGWTETTRLPNSPEYLRGVVNLRGIIIPIFDLRARFGQGLSQASEKHVIIILALGARVIGILVDTVSDILTIAQSEIKPAPEHDTQAQQPFLSGLIAAENRMVVLLDVSALLADDLRELVQSNVKDA